MLGYLTSIYKDRAGSHVFSYQDFPLSIFLLLAVTCFLAKVEGNVLVLDHVPICQYLPAGEENRLLDLSSHGETEEGKEVYQ